MNPIAYSQSQNPGRHGMKLQTCNRQAKVSSNAAKPSSSLYSVLLNAVKSSPTPEPLLKLRAHQPP